MDDNSMMKQLIIDSMADLEEDALIKYVRQAFSEGMNAHDVIDGIQAGMNLVGFRFENHEYYVAELIMSGVLYKEILDMPEFELVSENYEQSEGVLLIGTVANDLHDIGKNILGSLAKSAGFKVIDLGVDVPPAAFVDACIKYQPDILGLSGVMSFAQDSMSETIDALDAAGLRENLKIICGGATFTNNILDKSIGADFYSTDAWETIQQCIQWVSE